MTFAANLLEELRKLEQFRSSGSGVLTGGALVAAQEILSRGLAHGAGFDIEENGKLPRQEYMPPWLTGDHFLNQTAKLRDFGRVHSLYSTRKE